MTQQTTAERIATLINEGIDGDSGGGLVGHLAVAETIAAEIDDLHKMIANQSDMLIERADERDAITARNAFLLASAEAAQANLAACSAEAKRLRVYSDAYAAEARWEKASVFGTDEECAIAWAEYLRAARAAVAASKVAA